MIYEFFEFQDIVKLQLLNKKHYKLIIPRMLVATNLNTEIGLIETVVR